MLRKVGFILSASTAEHRLLLSFATVPVTVFPVRLASIGDQVDAMYYTKFIRGNPYYPSPDLIL